MNPMNPMNPMETPPYSSWPGKSARVAVAAGVLGARTRFQKHGVIAAHEGDLMHPSLWQNWAVLAQKHPDFLTWALDQMSAKEVQSLTRAHDDREWSCVRFFSKVPGMLAKLSDAGVDWNQECSLFRGMYQRMDVVLAALGDVSGLYSLMKEQWTIHEISAATLAGLNITSRPSTHLHLLAQSFALNRLMAFVNDAITHDIVGWLATKSSISQRDGLGRDALKIALNERAPVSLISALLAHGANPLDQDAKGRNALETLERRLRVYEREKDLRQAQELVRIRPSLVASTEKHLMQARVGEPWTAESVGIRKPRSL